MAITRAQQARQMYKKGSEKPVVQAGVMNYRPSEMVTVPKIAKSSPTTPTAKLAYITPEEQDILIDLNLYGSLKGKPNRGPGGLPSLEGDFGGPGGFGGFEGGADFGGASDNQGNRGDFSGARDTGTGNYVESNPDVSIQRQREFRAQQLNKSKEAEARRKAALEFEKRQKEIKDREAKELSDLGKKQVEDAVMKRRKRMGAKYVTDMFDLPADYDEEKDDTAAMLDLFTNNPYREDGTKRTLPTPTGIGLSLLEEPLKAGAKKTREFFSGPTTDIFGRKQKGVLSGGRFFYKGEPLTEERFANMSLTEKNQAYDSYMADRLAGKTDAYGNPIGGYRRENIGGQSVLVGGNDRDDSVDQKILPEDTMGDTEEEEVINPRDYTGLAPRFMGSIFDFTNLAEGGRVAAQQGGIMSQQGGIMPRLNDLSGDVSSAEQMLQEINQRLESAESTLGEGGGDPSSGLIAIQPNNFNNFQPRQMPIGNPLTPAPRYSSFEEMMKNRIQSDIPRSFINLEGVRSNPDGTPYTPPDNNQILSLMTNQTPSPQANVPLGPLQPAIQPGIQSPIAGAIRQGAMDGGRMRQMEMMQDEDDPTGGIMDLESGRQMYFLGKLVKKAGRAIKKVAKSPIGKAALLYFGGNALMGAGGGKGLGSFFGKGSFNPLRMAAKATSNGPMTQLSPFGKILSKLGMATGEEGGKLTLGGNIGLGIGLPFALDMLGVGKDDDKKMDLDEYYKTQGIDIDAIRNNPNRILARRFMAEGGDAEPVAKKTMPLLDMDGMEKDYREEGGFVPIGRMERADDVPARLSKNEFVFTADAVRNAGEGDIDKGAEVMYNMMKNLESGGEVSEESQGLDGAREMFQTSKRLEEVL